VIGDFVLVKLRSGAGVRVILGRAIDGSYTESRTIDTRLGQEIRFVARRTRDLNEHAANAIVRGLALQCPM
jgi:hypothetical protein